MGRKKKKSDQQAQRAPLAPDDDLPSSLTPVVQATGSKSPEVDVDDPDLTPAEQTDIIAGFLDTFAPEVLVFDVFQDCDDAAPSDVVDVVPPSGKVYDIAADDAPRSKQFQDDDNTQLASGGLVACSGLPKRSPWADVLADDCSNSDSDSCVATVSELPNTGHVGSLDSGTQCGPLDSAAPFLPVLPFTPPDEGEAGSESRSVARPLGHVNSEGDDELDGAHEASADASVGCERCALDYSDTKGVALGPQSDIHVNATSPRGTRSPGTCPGGGDEEGLDIAGNGTSHVQQAPSAHTDTVEPTDASGIMDFLAAKAAAAMDFQCTVRSILPDVYGDDDGPDDGEDLSCLSPSLTPDVQATGNQTLVNIVDKFTGTDGDQGTQGGRRCLDAACSYHAAIAGSAHAGSLATASPPLPGTPDEDDDGLDVGVSLPCLSHSLTPGVQATGNQSPEHDVQPQVQHTPLGSAGNCDSHLASAKQQLTDVHGVAGACGQTTECESVAKGDDTDAGQTHLTDSQKSLLELERIAPWLDPGPLRDMLLEFCPQQWVRINQTAAHATAAVRHDGHHTIA